VRSRHLAGGLLCGACANAPHLQPRHQPHLMSQLTIVPGQLQKSYGKRGRPRGMADWCTRTRISSKNFAARHFLPVIKLKGTISADPERCSHPEQYSFRQHCQSKRMLPAWNDMTYAIRRGCSTCRCHPPRVGQSLGLLKRGGVRHGPVSDLVPGCWDDARTSSSPGRLPPTDQI